MIERVVEMMEFYEGTPDTMIWRLSDAISCFDREWAGKRVPATKKQVQRLEDILGRYGHALPVTYQDYLRTMGQSDGGLLEKEWDGFCEPDINRILSLFADEDPHAWRKLENGLFLFSYHWTDAHFYLKLSDGEEDPAVTDTDGGYCAGSFEKYLFQKAFGMYQKTFAHDILMELSGPSPSGSGTTEERMDLVRQMAASFGIKSAWFSDDRHYFCYDEQYALEIDTRDGFSVAFSCDDAKMKDTISQELDAIFI